MRLCYQAEKWQWGTGSSGTRQDPLGLSPMTRGPVLGEDAAAVPVPLRGAGYDRACLWEPVLGLTEELRRAAAPGQRRPPFSPLPPHRDGVREAHVSPRVSEPDWVLGTG